jgi:hypothetical protein
VTATIYFLIFQRDYYSSMRNLEIISPSPDLPDSEIDLSVPSSSELGPLEETQNLRLSDVSRLSFLSCSFVLLME